MSCRINVVQVSGGVAQKTGLCILGQNIVNEKIFIVLYFWYIIIFVVLFVYMVYRICTLAIPSFRVSLMNSRLRGKHNDCTVKYALANCTASDWFVLNQIRRNVNPYFFRELIERLGAPLGSDGFRCV